MSDAEVVPSTWWQRYTPIIVWAGSLVAVVLIAVFVRDQFLLWIPISMAAAVIASFAIQLGIQRKEGYVTRVMLSVGGAVVIHALATLVLVLLP